MREPTTYLEGVEFLQAEGMDRIKAISEANRRWPALRAQYATGVSPAARPDNRGAGIPAPSPLSQSRPKSPAPAVGQHPRLVQLAATLPSATAAGAPADYLSAVAGLEAQGKSRMDAIREVNQRWPRLRLMYALRAPEPDPLRTGRSGPASLSTGAAIDRGGAAMHGPDGAEDPGADEVRGAGGLSPALARTPAAGLGTAFVPGFGNGQPPPRPPSRERALAGGARRSGEAIYQALQARWQSSLARWEGEQASAEADRLGAGAGAAGVLELAHLPTWHREAIERVQRACTPEPELAAACA